MMLCSIMNSFLLSKASSILEKMDLSGVKEEERKQYKTNISLFNTVFILTLMYIAETCILVLYYIQKKNTIIKRKNGMDFLPNSNKEKLKVLLIIVVLFIVDCSSSIVMIYITGIEILSFCNMILKGIVLLAATILSMVILNYTYYKHHWLGLIIISIGLLIFTFNDFNLNWSKIIKVNNSIGSIIVAILLGYIWSAFQEVLEKYLIEIKYISPFSVVGLEGLGGLIMMMIVITFFCIIPNDLGFSFTNYSIYLGHIFTDCSAILPYYGILFIGLFLINTFRILTNNYYYPTYKGISDVFADFFGWIIFSWIGLTENENKFHYYIIKVISYVLMTLGVVIYLEIIQLNFLGLKQNTRKEIISRTVDNSITDTVFLLLEQDRAKNQNSKK